MKWILPLVLLGSLGLLTACHKDDGIQGYVEAELTYISSPVSGKLVNLAVNRGDTVQSEQLLFQLEPEPEQANVQAAEAKVAAADANLKNLLYGKRLPELQQIQAQIKAAEAAVSYSQTQLTRLQKIVKSGGASQQQVDDAITTLANNSGNLHDLRAQLKSAELPARVDLIKAAEADLVNAEAQFKAAAWKLQQKTVDAPVNAQVFDTYYRVGEEVPATYPIISLLSAPDKKIIFFVPEQRLAQVKLNEVVHLTCDNCASNLTAKVNFISPSAEYTPPNIYSRSQNDQLVYRVEAKLQDHAQDLHPGEPVTISW